MGRKRSVTESALTKISKTTTADEHIRTSNGQANTYVPTPLLCHILAICPVLPGDLAIRDTSLWHEKTFDWSSALFCAIARLYCGLPSPKSLGSHGCRRGKTCAAKYEPALRRVRLDWRRRLLPWLPPWASDRAVSTSPTRPRLGWHGWDFNSNFGLRSGYALTRRRRFNNRGRPAASIIIVAGSGTFRPVR